MTGDKPRVRALQQLSAPKGGLYAGLNPRVLLVDEADTRPRLRHWMFGALAVVAVLAIGGWMQAVDDMLTANEKSRRASIITENCRVPITGERLDIRPVRSNDSTRPAYTCAIYATWPMAPREKSYDLVEVR